jgi:DNA gyrase subunit A
MGRSAAGVKAIDLAEGDEVVGMIVTDPARNQVLTICARGYGKRTPIDDFRPQNRGGKGIIAIDTSERNGPLVGLALVKAEDEVMLVTDRGQTIRTRVAEIRETGRNAQGVRVMNVEDDERVVAIEPVGESDDDSDDGEASEEGVAAEAAGAPADDAPSSDAGAAEDGGDDGAGSDENGQND